MGTSEAPVFKKDKKIWFLMKTSNSSICKARRQEVVCDFEAYMVYLNINKQIKDDVCIKFARAGGLQNLVYSNCLAIFTFYYLKENIL